MFGVVTFLCVFVVAFPCSERLLRVVIRIHARFVGDNETHKARFASLIRDCQRKKYLNGNKYNLYGFMARVVKARVAFVRRRGAG